jgi:hypothetical protein
MSERVAWPYLHPGGHNMASPIPTQAISKRSRRAWYSYDIGSSAYAAVVLLAIYAAHF